LEPIVLQSARNGSQHDRGGASIVPAGRNPDSDARRIATDAIARRYAGDDGAEEFARYADQQLKLLIRVRPTRIIVRDSVGEG
jgi:hypothetical protein